MGRNTWRPAKRDLNNLRPRPRRLGRRLALAPRRRPAALARPYVFAPTLTGLGERAHQLHAGVDLSLHIADVLGVIRYESLDDIVLVGHSYGGFVISGVAEVIPRQDPLHRLSRRLRPEDGEALVEIVQPAVQEVIRGAQARGEVRCPCATRPPSA